jgi:hypothetical protein
MTGPKKRKSKPIFQRNIPATPPAAINAHEFRRSTGSHLLSTTTVLSSTSRSSAPLTTRPSHESPDDPLGTQLYSDVYEKLLEKVERRKRPSQSVSVSEPGPCYHFASQPNQQALLEEWLLQYQSKFMDEWVQLEVSPLLTCLPQCTSCATPHVLFRCIDCFANSLFCKMCLLLFHSRKPFHHLQVL